MNDISTDMHRPLVEERASHLIDASVCLYGKIAAEVGLMASPYLVHLI